MWYYNGMRMGRIIFLCVIILVVIIGILLVGARFWHGMLASPPVRILTTDDLPNGAILVDFPAAVAITQETGGNAMFYYATPDALKTGGPIFGTFGYKIVSIVYEIPVRELTSPPMGNLPPGGRLTLNGLGVIPYDHFYARIVPGGAQRTDTAVSKFSSSGDVLLIHYMLISREEEVADKLGACF